MEARRHGLIGNGAEPENVASPRVPTLIGAALGLLMALVFRDDADELFLPAGFLALLVLGFASSLTIASAIFPPWGIIVWFVSLVVGFTVWDTRRKRRRGIAER